MEGGDGVGGGMGRRRGEGGGEIGGKVEGEYEVILLDVGGRVNWGGVLEWVMKMDFMFSGIVKEGMVMERRVWFVWRVEDFMGEDGEGGVKEIGLLWKGMERGS